MKIYLSGKITGATKVELALFDHAEGVLKAMGYDVVSPLKNGMPKNASYEEHMERDKSLILQCDCLLLLPTWRWSEGAVNEMVWASNNEKMIRVWEK